MKKQTIFEVEKTKSVLISKFSDSGDNSSREYLKLPKDKEKTREYILTMGPMHPSSYMKIMTAKKANKMDTCSDFWKMCWMTGSRIIVMLCDVSPGFQV